MVEQNSICCALDLSCQRDPSEPQCTESESEPLLDAESQGAAGGGQGGFIGVAVLIDLERFSR